MTNVERGQMWPVIKNAALLHHKQPLANHKQHEPR